MDCARTCKADEQEAMDAGIAASAEVARVLASQPAMEKEVAELDAQL